MKNFLQRILAKLSIFALMATSLFAIAPVHAAVVTSASNTLTRHQISQNTDMTIDFTIASPIEGASSDTLILTFSTNVDLTSIVIGDVDINDDAADTTLAADCSGTEDMSWTLVGQVMTFTACTADITDFAAGSVVSIEIGTVAAGGSNQVNNHSSAETATVSIAGTFADTGTISWAVVDSDQVSVTATVGQTMTFDLDIQQSAGSTSAPYTVALGALSTGAVTGSDDSSIDGIWVDLDTNATGGAVVQVKNVNGASGLVSASVGGDTIPSAAAAMSAGTANYGICVASAGNGVPAATTGTFQVTAASDFDGTCGATPASNTVGDLTTSFQDILDTNSAAISVGTAQIRVLAAIATTTAAHDDYADTLTFRATATF